MGAQGMKVRSRGFHRVVLEGWLTFSLITATVLAAEQPVPPGNADTREDSLAFKVVRIVQKKVDVLFKGFFENPFKLSPEPKFNWGRGSGTEYVTLGESIHGYTVYPLEKCVVEVEEPGKPGRKEERWFITLRKLGEDPVVIEMEKTAPVTERIATLEALRGKWIVQHRDDRLNVGAKVFEVFDGCMIREIEGERKTFTVVSVKDEEVVLQNRGVKKYTLPYEPSAKKDPPLPPDIPKECPRRSDPEEPVPEKRTRKELTEPQGIPFKVVGRDSRPVEIILSVVKDPHRLRLRFNIKWGEDKEYSVAFGEMLRGYRLGIPLVKRIVEIPGPDGPRKVERRFMTFSKPGEEPIVIEPGKKVRIVEQVATLEALKGKWVVQHRGEKLSEGEKVFEVFEGCIICEIGGDGRTFNVTGVTEKAVLLEEPNRHVLHVSPD